MSDGTVRTELVAAAGEEWAGRLRCDDPRVSDVVPAFDGSFTELIEHALGNPDDWRAQNIAKALPAVRERVAEMASLPVDTALIELLRASGNSERATRIAASRLGWASGTRRTLQSVGDEFSITRERVRQVVDSASGRIRSTYVPQVAAAIRAITEAAPIAADEASQILVERGMSTVPLQPKPLASAGRLLGYEVTFALDSSMGVQFVLAGGDADLRPVLRVARHLTGRLGLANVAAVESTLRREGRGYTAESITKVLSSSGKVDFLGDGWFWMPGTPPAKNRLRNVTRHILSVAPRLHVSDVYEGVRRRYRFLGIRDMPPSSVVAQLYEVHPEVILDADGFLTSVEPLDYRSVLGKSEQVLVDVLNAAPGGVMDRVDFEGAAIERGVSRGTFNAYTSYSPVLDHPARRLWCVRGRVDRSHGAG